jgi:Family of unknown function (DUF6111)
MIRTLFTEAALFFSPFAAYAIFLWATRAKVIDPVVWPLRTIWWLTIVALVAMIGGFIVIAEFSGAPVGSTYIPAHLENGHLVPGTTR